jgi:hypothetical protein
MDVPDEQRERMISSGYAAAFRLLPRADFDEADESNLSAVHPVPVFSEHQIGKACSTRICIRKWAIEPSCLRNLDWRIQGNARFQDDSALETCIGDDSLLRSSNSLNRRLPQWPHSRSEPEYATQDNDPSAG